MNVPGTADAVLIHEEVFRELPYVWGEINARIYS